MVCQDSPPNSSSVQLGSWRGEEDRARRNMPLRHGTVPGESFSQPENRTRVIDTSCRAASERSGVTAGAGVARGAVEPVLGSTAITVGAARASIGQPALDALAARGHKLKLSPSTAVSRSSRAPVQWLHVEGAAATGRGSRRQV